MDKGKVSVVIPTHNRVDLLPRAINSVLNQTYKNIEVIIVADGCTDGTKELIEKEFHGKVRFISYFPSKGGNYARNLGAKQSTGKYIAFLDDDDEWMREKLELQMNRISKEIGLVYTGCNIIYEIENISYRTKPFKEGDLKNEILIENCIGTTSTVLVDKHILFEAGLFDEGLGALQDYDLWIRICQITKVGVIDSPLINYYNYTKRKQVSSQTQKYKLAFECIENKYKNCFERLSIEEKKKHKIEKIFLLSNKAMRNGAPSEARKMLRTLKLSEISIKTFALYIFTYFSFKQSLKIRSKIK